MEVKNIRIEGDIGVGNAIKVFYDYIGENPEGATEFQRYRDGVLIEGEISDTYVLKITDYTHELVVAILPRDNQGNFGPMAYSDGLFIDYYDLEAKPVIKQYIYKLYDKDLNFVRVIKNNIITSDLSFSETINNGQGQVVINLNLPLNTAYLEGIKYLKIYASDNNGMEDELIYSGYLSKYSRIFSNNKENIQATFLSLISLLTDITYKDSNGNDEFTITGIDPAEAIKNIIDYFGEIYPGLLSYTNESIVDYGNLINLDVKNQSCFQVINNLMNGLTYHLFIGADGIVNFKPKSSTVKHYFTYEKDITALTIPEDYEQVVNAVRVQYGYIGGPHSGITDRAENLYSINKYGRKEKTIVNTSLYGNDSAVLYRDSYLDKNSMGKQNISITVNSKYPIETIHPGDTIKIRNLDFDIGILQVYSIQYQYEQVNIKLEYASSLGDEILNLTA